VCVVTNLLAVFVLALNSFPVTTYSLVDSVLLSPMGLVFLYVLWHYSTRNHYGDFTILALTGFSSA
jgi:hypothetical protein